MKKMLVAIMLSFGLSACSTPVPIGAMKNANYGPKPSSSEAIERTRSYFTQVLIDPDSLKLGCSQDIRRGWARDSQFDEPTFGYLVICRVNSKNQFGGYTGNKSYAVIVNGSNVFAVEIYRSPNQSRNIELWMGYAE